MAYEKIMCVRRFYTEQMLDQQLYYKNIYLQSNDAEYK